MEQNLPQGIVQSDIDLRSCMQYKLDYLAVDMLRLLLRQRHTRALLQKAHRVATIPHGLYHYCWNESGITATANGQALESLLKAHLQTPWMDDRYYMRVMNIQIDVYEQLKKEILLPYRSVSIVTKGLRTPERMKALLLRIVGVKGVCQLFYTLHKITRV